MMPAGGASGGRTQQLLYYDYLARDPGYLERDLARYRAVTGEAVAGAVRALGDGRVRLVVHPRRSGKEGAR
jgi:zinc protease